MSPEIDQFLVMGAIGAAIGYFVTRFLRKRKAGQCSTGSCCSSAPTAKKRSAK